MARKKTEENGEIDFSEVARIIEQVPLEEHVENSFLSYSYTVIESRAIPDARDGMKPVHRRILYSMFQDGFRPDRNHVKSAKIVGNVMGNFHPHGDSGIYGAMVRLAQPFSLAVPLIDPMGNFGAGPGDAPASSRYTEARLSPAALLLLEELREDTVDMEPNYDGSLTQPTVLPARFPNLLINGGSGIAVGLASNIATHNPGEIMDAARWLLTHPNATTERLMEFVPGPDFPTGGVIIGQDGIKEAFETGRGRFRIRGKYSVESIGRGKHQIIFTELPYEVAIEKVIEDVKKKINEGKLQGVADLKDLTDRRNGTRFVIETKAGINPEALVNELFQYTALEVTFGVNNNVIVDGNPVMLGLKDLLQVFLDHRKDVVTRRTQNRLSKREHRLHLVEGLLKALADIDEVIATIRRSPDSDTARDRLMKKFKVDEIQADYILSLQLRRLTRFDQIELNDEKKNLLEEIKELKTILDDPDVLRKVIGDELVATRKIIDTPRRSVIEGGSLAEHLEAAKVAVASTSVEVEDAPCVITLYTSGAMTRTAEPVTVSNRGKIDPIISVIDTTVRGTFVVASNQGNGYRVQALHVSDQGKSSPKDIGLSLKSGERLVALGRNETKDGEAGLALGTKQGVVKISNTDFPLRSDEFPVISLADGDEVIGGGWVSDAATTDFAFMSTDTSVLRFEASKVRPQGSKGGGMAGIKLAAGAHALTFAVVPAYAKETAEVVTYTGKTIKRSLFSQGPVKGRATGGQRFHALRSGLKETGLVFGYIGTNPLVVDAKGKTITLPDLVKRDGSGTPVDTAPAVAGSRS